MEGSHGIRGPLESGSVVFGARAGTYSPTVIELYGRLGLDFVWLDLEHGGPSPYDSHALEGLTRAADSAGIDLLVRLPSGDPPLIRKVLDAGVRTLLIPQVEAAADVERAVRATRFVYEGDPGDRGMSSARANAWGNVDNAVRRGDETVCLGVMIETREAVEQLEAILEVSELGFVFVGPGDLSIQLGYPGARDDPELHERIDAINADCLSSDVPVGTLTSDPAEAVAAIDAGYQLVRIGGDLGAIQSTLRERLAAIEAAR